MLPFCSGVKRASYKRLKAVLIQDLDNDNVKHGTLYLLEFAFA
jgi:hypothetical protein